MGKRFSGFELREMTFISLLVALSVVVKPFIKNLAHLFTDSIMVPGGVLVGGLYMIWLTMGMMYVKKIGTCTMVGLLQGIIALLSGFGGRLGFMVIPFYTLPGVMADIYFYLANDRGESLLHSVMATVFANLIGTLLSNYFFFGLTGPVLFIALFSGMLSGAFGGYLAYLVMKRIPVVFRTKNA